ncbi:hypothetical protein FKM82_012476 [Ascaphus truei]
MLTMKCDKDAELNHKPNTSLASRTPFDLHVTRPRASPRALPEMEGARDVASEKIRRAETPGSGKTSQELLSVGSPGGLYSKLLINSHYNDKKGASSPIVRIPRSSLLDRVQNFLPQMAHANESLSKEMENAPASAFDIENVDDVEENIIEMNVALVELSSSDSSEDEAETSSDGSSDSDSDLAEEVTEDNMRLKRNVKKGKIQVLDN